MIVRGQSDGTAVFMALRAGERLVATSYSFVSGPRHDFTLTTFDEEFAEVCPGRLLNELYVRWCYDHQVALIDWHWKAEHWKSKWANRREPLGVYTLVAAERGWRAVSDELRRMPKTGGIPVDSASGTSGWRDPSSAAGRPASRAMLPLESLSIDVLDATSLESADDEWDDLYRRVPAASYALRHRWCADGWATIGQPRGARCSC